MDKSLLISKDESKKLQDLIDEHLRAKGITSLLDEPVSIIDVEKFQEEIDKTKDPKSKELKRANRLKHKITVELDNNPDFYKPLADKLEELIEMRKKNQITQVELFKKFDQIQAKIVNKSKEAEGMGFGSEREFAVYKTLEQTLKDAKGKTGQIFEDIAEELSITGWQTKEDVKKSMRVKIKGVLRGNVPANELQPLTLSLMDRIKRNQ